MAPNQHDRYANAMTTWGSGYGLFHPPSDIHDQAKPGMCGYIDDSGIWQAIVDLTDESALNAAGLSKPEFALLKPPSTEIWGPRYTDTVKGDTISGEAALAAGIPAEFSTALSYSAQSDFAAVLLCSDPVRLVMYPHKAPFRKWARLNAKKLLQMCGDVATHGFYVMTSTWSAQDVWINAWTNKDNSVTIGVKGSVPHAGAAGGSVQYHRGGSAGGWHQPETVGDERRVVFFGGVYFKFNKLFRRFSEVNQPGWAGYLGDDEEGKFVVESGNDVYEVESSEI